MPLIGLLVSFHPEIALFRNLCVNLRNYLFPLDGGTRNFLISLTLRKIANFCIGNLIYEQYTFMDGHLLLILLQYLSHYAKIMQR